MKLNILILQEILDIAIANDELGFMETDLIAVSVRDKDELIFHLDYLTDRGFIIGEFIPITFTDLKISSQSIRFIRGKITQRGKEYLTGLKTQQSKLTITA